ncbi:DUF1963 domain-containing protein [Priestia megaterium]|nr:DUF1963 domain-containing protein [Priestia megaterium]
MSYIDELISEKGLESIKEEIKEALYTCIMMNPTQEETVEVGSTKMGGYPDLPPNQPWPVYKEKYLNFISQWNLSEFNEKWKEELLLPSKGFLYFFYYDDGEEAVWGDADEKGGWRVLYYEGEKEALQQTKVDVPFVYPQCKVELTYELRLGDVYIEQDELYEAFDELMLEINKDVPFHQIGGTPWSIQNDVLEECQYYAEGGEEWILLFQVDSDPENLNMMWGDVGMLYFCLPKQALLEKQFQHSWLIMQCS